MLRRVSIAVLAACAVMPGLVPARAKAQAFEVVSIRPTGPFDVNRIGGSGTSATGYYAKGLPLSTTVIMAYFPAERLGRPFPKIPGWPSSLDKEAYDIQAKFDAPTAEKWNRLTNDQQGALIRPMLQAMLAERCKLKAHMTMVVGPAEELVLAKHGPKLKETPQGEPPPEHALPIAGDAMIVPGQDATFYHTSMTALATWLSGAAGIHVVDRTGLTRRYDFVVPSPVRQTPAPQAPGEASDPASGPRWLYDLSGLGLELRLGKAPDQMLVIDHIEEPTPN